MNTVTREPAPEKVEAIEPGPSRIDPDADLVENLRRDRSQAAEELVTLYGRRAYQLAFRITGNARDAQEVTQDALWRAFSKVDTFRGESAFGSWVYRITANAAYEKRRRRHHERHEASWDEGPPTFDSFGRHVQSITDWSPSVQDPALQQELRAELSRAIDELLPDYRTVVVMRDVEGMSNPEVAEALKMTLPAIKSRLHRGRLFLRERLSRYLTEGRRSDSRLG